MHAGDRICNNYFFILKRRAENSKIGKTILP